MTRTELRQWLALNDRGWRLFVGFLCALCLGLFLHFREVRVEVLELNTPAPRYIVTQVDFDYPDLEATALLKQRVMQEIGPIFEIDEHEVREARIQFENQILQKGRKNEEFYHIAEDVEASLLEARFTDAQTLERILEIGVEESDFYEHLPSEGEERERLPQRFWDSIIKSVSRVSTSGETKQVVDAFAANSWTLIQDVTLTRTLRGQLAKGVPERYSHMVAGTRVIDQGEVVTTRHLAMMQSMKQALSDHRMLSDPSTILSDLILSLILVSVTALYFRISLVTFIRSLTQVSLFVTIIILSLFLSKVTEFLLLRSGGQLIEEIRYPILAPFATLLICLLLSPRTALYAATVLSIILSISLAVETNRFLVLNLVSSIAVIIAAKRVRRRTEIFSVCLKSWGASLPVLYAFSLGEGHLWSGALLLDIGSSLVFLTVTAILAIGLLPALESLFQVLTDMSLMEYMNPSNDLLNRMCTEVPGTYNHSLILGNLTEACALAIGANGLFCRTATLYHDIGKLKNPFAYGENQQGGINLHQLLMPEESAQLIISHVPDGVELARAYRLPEPFIDIIREHHGTTLAYYFYRKALDQGRVVDEAQFRYPGPKPRTRESAIIMLCDAIEAASRSNQEEDLKALINRIVAEKAEEGQLDDCQLTFEELTRVKNALFQNLQMASHVRIKYPKKLREAAVKDLEVQSCEPSHTNGINSSA